jgi:hypothetical protein
MGGHFLKFNLKQDLSSSERRRIVFRPGRGFGIRRCFGIKRNVKTEA